MTQGRICSECGATISEASGDGLCPRCLMDLALEAEAETETAVETRPENSCTIHTGRVFGNYDVLEQIGQGGMGVVYRARQRGLGRVVALKLLLAGSRATEAEIKRFHTEARAAATLKHPNVVAIYEVGEHEGQHYFSMDYIQGRSLAEVIRRTPLPAARAARYVKIIAEAIHYAHQQGILHRDLKPHNVLIDAEDEPRITDFGLARQIEVESDLTISGAVLGTPSYMPPEQAAGKRREIGRASDVYSLGAILYDLLTGHPPFRADTPLDTLRQVIDTEPAPPRLVNRKVPRDLETICLKCLAKTPVQRYSYAQELADDLGRFLRQEPIHARPVSSVGRIWRWSRRNPVLATFAGAIGLLLVLLALAAVLLRHTSLESNTTIAWNSARMIRSELLPVKIAVNEVASSPELAQLIASNSTQALSAFLEDNLQSNEKKSPPWLLFQNWVIMTPAGRTVIRWPNENIEILEERSSRDYFKGATNKWTINPGARDSIDWVYPSRGYKSQDDGYYKFGVSRVILNPDGKLVGVLALMVSLKDFAHEVLGPITAGREIVLVSEWDNWDPSRSGQESPSPFPSQKREFRIVAHPSFGRSNRVEFISHRFLEKMAAPATPEPRGNYFYRDPLDKYPGWWLAGFAQVRDTHFIVIHKTRDRVTDALATAAAVTAFVVVFFFGWQLARRRANARKGKDE